MRPADDRRSASVMISSSIRLSFAGFEVGWMMIHVLAADVLEHLDEDFLIVEPFDPRIDQIDDHAPVHRHPPGDGFGQRQVGVAGDQLRFGDGGHVGSCRWRDGFVTLTPLITRLGSWEPKAGAWGRNMTQIDYFFATISPFVYLAGQPAGGRLRHATARRSRYMPLDAPALVPAHRRAGAGRTARQPQGLSFAGTAAAGGEAGDGAEPAARAISR